MAYSKVPYCVHCGAVRMSHHTASCWRCNTYIGMDWKEEKPITPEAPNPKFEIGMYVCCGLFHGTVEGRFWSKPSWITGGGPWEWVYQVTDGSSSGLYGEKGMFVSEHLDKEARNV